MSADKKLVDAFALDTTGAPAEALALAQRLLAEHRLTSLDQARALDLEGICYQELEQPAKAVQALEAGRALLGPNNAKELGSILDNLGRVYSGQGNYSAAATLYKQAFQVFASSGNHSSMARVANNRAGIALSQRKNKEARKQLALVDREANLARELDHGDLDKDDRAAFASMHGWLALNEGDNAEALKHYETALRLWQEFHGERHPLTAWGMLRVGQAEALNGQQSEGVAMMGKGLAWMAATVGRGGMRYTAAESAYARLLDQSGDTVQAALLRQDAETKRAAFARQGCQGCTISVMALH